MPQASHPNGTTVLVESIESNGDAIELDLLAINGSDEAINLSGSGDPMLLVDRAGNQFLARNAEIKLEPYTTTELDVEFLGKPTGDLQQLALRLNPKYGNDYGSPKITLDAIPVQRNGEVEFVPSQPRQASFSEAIVYHANGLSVEAKALRTAEREIELDLEAINGSEDTVKLFNSSSDRPFLQDEQSNRYYLIPSATNPDLSISAGQKLTGTLRFAGHVPSSSRQLSLFFNSEYGGDQDYSTNPKLVIPNLALSAQ